MFLEESLSYNKNEKISINQINNTCYNFIEALAYSEVAWNNITIQAMKEEYKCLNEESSNEENNKKSLIEKFKEWIKKVIEFIKKLLTKIKDFYKNIFNKDMMIEETYSRLLNKAKDKLKNNTDEIDNVPELFWSEINNVEFFRSFDSVKMIDVNLPLNDSNRKDLLEEIDHLTDSFYEHRRLSIEKIEKQLKEFDDLFNSEKTKSMSKKSVCENIDKTFWSSGMRINNGYKKRMEEIVKNNEILNKNLEKLNNQNFEKIENLDDLNLIKQYLNLSIKENNLRLSYYTKVTNTIIKYKYKAVSMLKKLI